MSTNTPSRPNYFDLLGLDPAKNPSPAEIQAAIETKKSEWSKGAIHPTKGPKFRQYLSMSSDIQLVMLNEELRKKEAKEFLEEQSSGNQAKKAEFEEKLGFAAQRGFIFESEITAWVKTYTGVLTEADIRKQTGRFEIRHETAASDKDDALDDPTMKNVQVSLDILKKKDLYDFLGLRGPRTALLVRAKEIYRSNSQVGNKTQEVTENIKLAGQAEVIFKDDAAQARYNNALSKQVYAELLEPLMRATADSPTKTVYANQFQSMVEKVKNRGFDVDKADAYIRQRARELKVNVEVADLTQLKKIKNCPNCGAPHGENENFCPQCRLPLRMKCPGCGQMVSTANAACPNCNFPVGLISVVLEWIKGAETYILKHEYDEAIQVLKAARLQWAPIPPRPMSDEYSRLLEERLQQAETAQQKVAELIGSLHRAINEQRFFEARRILVDTVIHQGQTAFTGEKAQIEKAIQEANALMGKARSFAPRSDAAVEGFQKVLSICRDHQEAREMLIKTPPTAPKALQSRVGNKVISLSWQSSSSKGVKYSILRKYRTQPVSNRDGEILATVTGNTYDDDKAEIGLPILYAVYADREGVLSPDAAVLTTPVLCISDVADVAKEVGNSQIRLFWRPPANIDRMIVVRSDAHRPMSITDGISLLPLDKTQVVDHDLENGHTYYYAIYSVFKDHQGKDVLSPGVHIEAMPDEPPSIIESLHFEVTRVVPHRELVLTWQPPNKGDVAILRGRGPVPLKPGAVIAQSALATHGEVLSGARGQVQVTVKDSGVTYFTPVVLFQSMAYIGKSHEYTNVDDVTQLSGQNQNVTLQLRWEWPHQCQQAVVAYNSTTYPTLGDTSSTRIEVSRSEYDINGVFTIRNPAKQDYFITVFAVIVQNGQRLIASGLSNSARCRISLAKLITISYEVVQARRFMGKGTATLKLTVKGTGWLPDLILKHETARVPTAAEDGEILLKIEGQELSASGLSTLDLPLPNVEKRNCFGRLFLADETLYDIRGGYVRLMTPAQEKLRLG